MARLGGFRASFLLIIAVGICIAAPCTSAVEVSPPPPPPPTPPPLHNGPTCTLCVDHNLTIPATADPSIFSFYPYVPFETEVEDDLGECRHVNSYYGLFTLSQLYWDLANEGMATYDEDIWFEPMPNCIPKAVRWCSDLPSQEDAYTYVAALVERGFGSFDPYFQKALCPTAPPGYFVTYGIDGCGINLKKSSFCGPMPDGFPGCKCNKTQGITPLKVDPHLTPFPGLPGRTNHTVLYCFSITNATETVESSCSSTSLNKVEIWADWTQRRAVKGIRVTPKGGPTKWLSPSWGPSTSNTLKASSLNWTMDQAVGGEVCIELTNLTNLFSFCMNTSCFMSLYNEKRDCCPAYAAAPSPFWPPPY